MSKDRKLSEYGFHLRVPMAPTLTFKKRKILKKKRSGQLVLTSYGFKIKREIEDGM